MKPTIFGGHLFDHSGHFDGTIGGAATVAKGVELHLSGMVGGDLLVEQDAVVHLTSMVGGRIHNKGGRILSARTS